MLGYRKKSFGLAHKFLSNIRQNLNDLNALVELQKLLLSEIIRAEIKIRELKSTRTLLQDAHNVSAKQKKRIQYLTNRIEGYRQLNYIWRSFGDAVAFLYLDKFALKQTYFNTANPYPKQGAGFIAGKGGLESEITMLENALAADVPAVLVDLTNSIRHGDICLLGEADPYLIEVKSTGKINNQRGRRQARSIRQLHEFFESDYSEQLRGFSEVRRASTGIEEQTYEDEINRCIEKAFATGEGMVSPEESVYYVALTDTTTPLDMIFSKLNIQEPWVFILNMYKSNRSWSPYPNPVSAPSPQREKRHAVC